MGTEIRVINKFQIEIVDTSALGNRYLLTTQDGRKYELSQMMTDLVITLQIEGDADATARKLSEYWGQEVSPEQVEYMAENYLKKVGLIDTGAAADEQPEQDQPNEGRQQLDQIHFRLKLMPASLLKPISKVTRLLYHRDVGVVLIAAIALVHYLVLRNFSRATLTEVIFNSSGHAYLMIYALLYTCVLWHELGHVSALAKFGKDAKEIGFGIYFIFPVLYTDVSECWVLKRWQRVIVDCGGIYFQAMTALPLYGAYLLTGSPIPIFLILMNFSLILLILNPILKFDGYWMLADALGIINLREKSLALVSHYYHKLILRRPSELTERLQFPRGIRVCGLIYGLCSSSLMWVWLLLLVLYAPRVITNYVTILVKSGSMVAGLLSEYELLKSVELILKLLLQTIPVFALAMLLYRLNKQLIQFAITRFSKEQR